MRCGPILALAAGGGITLDNAAYNCALDVCAGAGQLDRARDLIKEMRSHSSLDIITFNTLLKGHCNAGDLKGAKKLLIEMKEAGLQPNDVSFNCLINAAVTSRSGNFDEAWEIIDLMEKSGVKVDHYTISIMMKSLKKARNNHDVQRALALLDRTGTIEVCSDEILLNTVLETCIRHRENTRLKAVVAAYRRSDMRPSVHTYGSLIKACSNLKKVDQCQAFWREMEEVRGMDPNDIVLGCMLDALVCNGMVNDAVVLFNKWRPAHGRLDGAGRDGGIQSPSGQDFGPAWAAVQQAVPLAPTVDDAWQAIISVAEDELIDRRGLNDHGDLYRGRATPPRLRWVCASVPKMPRYPRLDIQTCWIKQWAMVAKHASSLDVIGAHERGRQQISRLRRAWYRYVQHADGGQQQSRLGNALAIQCSALDYMPSAALRAVAMLVDEVGDMLVAAAIRRAKARFGDWIEQQALLGGSALHAFTKEPMQWHPSSACDDGGSGAEGNPVPTPAGQMQAVQLLVEDLEGRLAASTKARAARGARNLGVDFAVGTKMPRNVRKRRLKQASRRVPRLRRPLGPARRRRIAARVAGLEASYARGVCCTGLSDVELQQARTMAVKAIELRPAGKSATAVLALIGADCDPIVKATLDPISTLHRAVWEQWLPKKALDTAFAAAVRHVGLRSQARGPISAAVLSLRRVGWQCEQLDKWTSDAGDVHCIGDTSPWLTKKLLRRSCEDWQARQLSEHDAPWLAVGVNFGQLRKWVDRGRPSSTVGRSWPTATNEERGYLRSCIVNGQWTNVRKFGNNPRYASSDFCEPCPGQRGDIWHRHLECQALTRLPDGGDLPREMALLLAQRDNQVIRMLVERLLFPIPWLQWRPPAGGFLDHLRWCCGEPGEPFCGQSLYCDGALHGAALAGGRGAQGAAAVVELPPVSDSTDPGPGSRTKALGSPLVGPWQSIEGSELLSVLIVLRHSIPPIVLHCDASFVVDGLNLRGAERTTIASSAWGHLWRLARAALDDFGGLSDHGLAVVKVPGHATLRQVREGAITLKQRRGNYEADLVAGGIAAALGPLPEASLRSKQAVVIVDGVARWLAKAGTPAGAARDDSAQGYAQRDLGNRIGLSLTSHVFATQADGSWHCQACLKTARTEKSKQVLFRGPCKPKAVASGARRAPASSAAAGAALAAAAITAATAGGHGGGGSAEGGGGDPSSTAAASGPARRERQPSSAADLLMAASRERRANRSRAGAVGGSGDRSRSPRERAVRSVASAPLVPAEVSAERAGPSAPAEPPALSAEHDELGHVLQRCHGYVVCNRCNAYARERLGSFKALSGMCVPGEGDAGRIRRLRGDRIRRGVHPTSGAHLPDAAAGEVAGLSSSVASA
ncbi:unnamed protein product [Prorocentrum cordatum]|uniref:RNase H type-1 domain-containing protein n=1 Tax=Prorocentrum cordatum TaxID=2364126 RepID=A0ABN9RZG2_9DINO|nr:unnamed protein product [Polarella glacialis]